MVSGLHFMIIQIYKVTGACLIRNDRNIKYLPIKQKSEDSFPSLLHKASLGGHWTHYVGMMIYGYYQKYNQLSYGNVLLLEVGVPFTFLA